ncbi:MAG: ATP-binding protein [Anaerolineae bacterium]|nr:ATP-binding protein [Anaerolineae bacterium]
MLKNAYTDAPELHPNLFLGSLHLLFWLLFHPAAWGYHLARLDSTLHPDFTLAHVGRARWRLPLLRRLLLQACFILPLLVGLPVGLTLWGQSGSIEVAAGTLAYVVAITVTLALIIGAGVSVAAGIVSSTAVGVAVGIIASWVEDDALVVPLAIGTGLGIMGSITSHLASSRPASPPSQPISPVAPRGAARRTQVGGIVIGVLIGVIAIEGVRFGLTALAGLTVGLPAEQGYWLARAIVVGTSFGAVLGWRRGIAAGLAGGMSVSLVYGLAALGVNSNIGSSLGGLAAGLLFGTSFGVTVALPYVLAAQIAGPGAGAWAGALGSWGRHVFRNEVPLWPALPLGLGGIVLGFTWAWWRPVLLYPLTAAWNLILFRLDERRGEDRSLLRWHSAFWDEGQRLPLVGLDEHLLLVMARCPDEGQAALAYLSQSHQRWAAQAVQIELEARRLENAQDITAVGQIHHHLVSGALTGPASVLLRHFSRLSQDVEAGLNQATVYHQRLALNSIEDRLNSLLRELTASSEPYAARFYPIAGGWQQLVAGYGRGLAEAVERSQELDNPYVVGVPLTEQQDIFVGRTDIVARIEQLLLDRRRPPLLLYGQRRMGKTSLLRNLGRLLPSTMLPLFVDGQRIALAGDYPDFLYNLAAGMSRSAQKQRSLRLPALSRENLAASPFTCFNDWLDEVERTLEAQGYSIALLALDEFEMLDSVLHKGRFDVADVLSMLRHMIQHRSHFKVMLAGSHSLEEFQSWASYLINVQVVKIGYLEPDEARQLVERPSLNFSLRYEPEASRRVLELTRGHPALVQLLCYELVTLKNEQDAALRRLARLEDVEAAVPRVLSSGTFFFSDIQQNQLDAAGVSLLRCLARQGEGTVISRDDLASYVPGAEKLDQVLAALLQRDLLETMKGGYRFQVELIRRWFEAAG